MIKIIYIFIPNFFPTTLKMNKYKWVYLSKKKIKPYIHKKDYYNESVANALRGNIGIFFDL